jgi:hypothetical protein
VGGLSSEANSEFSRGNRTAPFAKSLRLLNNEIVPLAAAALSISAGVPEETQGAFMPATGELIRLMNYIDDIATTLRRISASIPAMTNEECVRLAEYIRKSEPSYESVVQRLEQAGKENKEKE